MVDGLSLFVFVKNDSIASNSPFDIHAVRALTSLRK